MIINVLLAVTILFCLHSIDSSIAGDCGENGGGVGTPTVTGDHVYPFGWTCEEDPNLKYDAVNSAETIDRNGSADLFVLGNNGPYTWSVSGTGFWFDATYSSTTIQTIGTSATIYVDGSACGSGTITITGCDGTQVQGYVRCTTGVWFGTDNCFTLALADTPGCIAENTTVIEGKTKVDLIYGCKFYLTGCGPGIYSPPYSPSVCGGLVEPYHTYSECSVSTPPNDYRCCYVRIARFYEWRCN